jgi:PadR family transcriptional regulator, regulatory protein PadR
VRCGTASRAKVKVLTEFLADPLRKQYGYGLMKTTKLKSGTLYPLLSRMQEDGWIEGQDECIDEHEEGRPKRRLYRLTSLGQTAGKAAIAAFYRDLGPAPTWALGGEGAC